MPLFTQFAVLSSVNLSDYMFYKCAIAEVVSSICWNSITTPNRPADLLTNICESFPHPFHMIKIISIACVCLHPNTQQHTLKHKHSGHSQHSVEKLEVAMVVDEKEKIDRQHYEDRIKLD